MAEMRTKHKEHKAPVDRKVKEHFQRLAIGAMAFISANHIFYSLDIKNTKTYCKNPRSTNNSTRKHAFGTWLR